MFFGEVLLDFKNCFEFLLLIVLFFVLVFEFFEVWEMLLFFYLKFDKLLKLNLNNFYLKFCKLFDWEWSKF